MLDIYETCRWNGLWFLEVLGKFRKNSFRHSKVTDSQAL
jgi:hypothetical protein